MTCIFDLKGAPYTTAIATNSSWGGAGAAMAQQNSPHLPMSHYYLQQDYIH